MEELGVPAGTDEVTRFDLHVPDEVLDDLSRRLATTRWPERETVTDSTQGAQLDQMQALVDYWLHSYDWRRLENKLNTFGQYRTRIDGLDIHLLHVRSRHQDAMPLLLTHGWPGSVVEFVDAIGPLTDPTAFGGRAEDAFHVVIPSLPGFGFSGRPVETGWTFDRIARAWTQLMSRLGYRQYIAQGGDWGSAVTLALGAQAAPALKGIHLNFFDLAGDMPVTDVSTVDEDVAQASIKHYFSDEFGYALLQSTRPQTVGYGLADSPVGQAAWIYEKLAAWCDGDAHDILGLDKILDAIMLYWLPGTGASSGRIYWEYYHSAMDSTVPAVPVGYSAFPGELMQLPQAWAERTYGDNLIYFNKPNKGGHFAAFEQPALFTDEVRAFAGLLR
ncbi:epoxide hydrolase 1 [Kibdelosporangium philippinense]|uniref:Epoxide hydrolase 1 n=1 Tax=Kibdelosporangium philippinense TaxID=211113 RepID=A0ABS8Z5A4_9PSEU|nr:epoxide hydrolase 1 [Kibdelosporangium philippinense]